jgi:hypothetical protein
MIIMHVLSYQLHVECFPILCVGGFGRRHFNVEVLLVPDSVPYILHREILNAGLLGPA